MSTTTDLIAALHAAELRRDRWACRCLLAALSRRMGRAALLDVLAGLREPR